MANDECIKMASSRVPAQVALSFLMNPETAEPSPAASPASAMPAAPAMPAARTGWRRWLLLSLLSLLSLLMLGTLVWLTRNHEIAQVQRALDRDAADAAHALHQELSQGVHDLHSLSALHPHPAEWRNGAMAMLQTHREWLQLAWLTPDQSLLAKVDSPYYPPPGTPGVLHTAPDAPDIASDAALACPLADQLDGPVYAPSRYMQRSNVLGEEVMTLCLPLRQGTQHAGYLLATYSLGGMLVHLLGADYTQHQSVSLTELDGTRLAVRGGMRHAGRVFSARQILNLPGNTLALRMDGVRPLPDLLPNVLTALVTVLSIALVTVLGLLVHDFRARQRAENELAEALAFRKAMEDSLVTGLRARDRQGRITYVNPAFCNMVGWRADELIGQCAPISYWPPELAQAYTHRQAQRLSGSLPMPREGEESIFMRRDGTRFPALVIEAPLINAQGVHTGWMGAVLDLTAQRQAEELSRTSQERLQASARLAAVGEMASLMSHELNQPLAVIASYASGALNLLQAPPPPAAASANAAEPQILQEMRTALARIAEQAGRAGRVINSVHDLVRRRANSREAALPAELIDTVLPLVQLQARKLDAQVQVQAPASLPRVWCNPTMIEQVLVNLARNGLQAMADAPAPRLLRISAAPEEKAQRVAFSISDTGEGISAEVAARLYTPFFTTKAEGMGLGLSLCRTVVEQHGGQLCHANNSPHGTVFSFSLPVKS